MGYCSGIARATGCVGRESVRGISTDRSSDLQFPEPPNVDPPGPVLRPFRVSVIVLVFLDSPLANFLTLELSTRYHDLARARALPSGDVDS